MSTQSISTVSNPNLLSFIAARFAKLKEEEAEARKSERDTRVKSMNFFNVTLNPDPTKIPKSTILYYYNLIIENEELEEKGEAPINVQEEAFKKIRPYQRKQLMVEIMKLKTSCQRQKFDKQNLGVDNKQADKILQGSRRSHIIKTMNHEHAKKLNKEFFEKYSKKNTMMNRKKTRMNTMNTFIDDDIFIPIHSKSVSFEEYKSNQDGSFSDEDIYEDEDLSTNNDHKLKKVNFKVDDDITSLENVASIRDITKVLKNKKSPLIESQKSLRELPRSVSCLKNKLNKNFSMSCRELQDLVKTEDINKATSSDDDEDTLFSFKLQTQRNKTLKAIVGSKYFSKLKMQQKNICDGSIMSFNAFCNSETKAETISPIKLKEESKHESNNEEFKSVKTNIFTTATNHLCNSIKRGNRIHVESKKSFNIFKQVSTTDLKKDFKIRNTSVNGSKIDPKSKRPLSLEKTGKRLKINHKRSMDLNNSKRSMDLGSVREFKTSDFKLYDTFQSSKTTFNHQGFRVMTGNIPRNIKDSKVNMNMKNELCQSTTSLNTTVKDEKKNLYVKFYNEKKNKMEILSMFDFKKRIIVTK